MKQFNTPSDIRVKNRATEKTIAGGVPYNPLSGPGKMLEMAPSPIAQYDKEGRYTYVNSAFESIISCSRDELLGKKHSELLLWKELTPFWQDSIGTVIQTGKGITLDRELATPSGMKYYRIILTPEKNIIGQVVSVLLVGNDLSEQKRDLDALRQSEKQLELILQTTPGGVTIIDISGRIYFANQTAEQILALDSKNHNDRYYNDPTYKITTVDGEILDETELPYIQVMMTGMPVYGMEHAIEHPDGRKVYLSVNAAPLLDYKDQITAIITSITDITKLKVAEQERERLIEELQDALNKVKTLSGLLPICAFCKDIRDDSGYWHQVEAYVKNHSKANFSHGVCPDCAKKHYPEYFKDGEPKKTT